MDKPEVLDQLGTLRALAHARTACPPPTPMHTAGHSKPSIRPRYCASQVGWNTEDEDDCCVSRREFALFRQHRQLRRRNWSAHASLSRVEILFGGAGAWMQVAGCPKRCCKSRR